jgi:hypothetical protein
MAWTATWLGIRSSKIKKKTPEFGAAPGRASLSGAKRKRKPHPSSPRPSGKLFVCFA